MYSFLPINTSKLVKRLQKDLFVNSLEFQAALKILMLLVSS